MQNKNCIFLYYNEESWILKQLPKVAEVIRFCEKMTILYLKYYDGAKGRVQQKKKANYPHFVDKHLTPPPLSMSAEVNNIHTKEFFLIHIR